MTLGGEKQILMEFVSYHLLHLIFRPQVITRLKFPSFLSQKLACHLFVGAPLNISEGNIRSVPILGRGSHYSQCNAHEKYQ